MKCKIRGSKRRKLIQTFIKVTVHLVMFILFLRFYFIDQFIQFLKHESAFFEVEQSKEIKREAPSILLCSYYTDWTLLKEKYNVTVDDIDQVFGYENIPDIPGRTKFDLYQEMSGKPFTKLYILNSPTSTLFTSGHLTKLSEGTNLIGNISVFLTWIVTSTRLGNCYKITTNELSSDTFLIDNIMMITKFHHWQVFITGKNDWHGVLNSFFGPDDYFHHNLLMEDSGETFAIMDVNISPTTVVGLNGIENADECVVQHLKKAKCPYVCSPIIFNYLNEWIPPCSKNEDYLCMLDYYQKTMTPELPCYHEKRKKATKIKGVFQKVWFMSAGDNDPYELELKINHITTDLYEMEEKYILSTEDFIGTVGGSLGLFLGFSFLTFVTDVIGKVFDCLHHRVECLSSPSLSVTIASKVHQV